MDERVYWLCGRHVCMYSASLVTMEHHNLRILTLLLTLLKMMPVEAHLQLEAAEKKAAGSGQGKTRRFWYPTVLLNLDVKKALPKEGVEWLFSRTTAKQVKNGRMDLEIVVLDAEGQIVAISNHIALAVDSQRNLAKRNTGSSKM